MNCFVLRWQGQDADRPTAGLYQALALGAIPVYFGARTVGQHLPHPDAVIDASAFETPTQLAHYLRRVAGDGKLYAKHMQWGMTEVSRGNELRSIGCGMRLHWVGATTHTAHRA